MISKPTVLVLGAGASAPYGFPTGEEFAKQVCDGLLVRQNAELRGQLLQLGFQADELSCFRRRLRRSGQPSVDAFLEKKENRDFRDIGKAAIACVLAAREDEGALYAAEPKEHWYAYLFQQMDRDAERETFHENKLSVVTFNYDRSVEHFLHNSLQNTYGMNDADTARLLQRITILHVYGQLGDHPYLGTGGRPYGDVVKPGGIKECMSAIRILPEDEESSPEFLKAHGSVRTSRATRATSGRRTEAGAACALPQSSTHGSMVSMRW